MSFLGISLGGKGDSSSLLETSFYYKLVQIDRHKYFQDDGIKLLNGYHAEFTRQDEKFVPKSFEVYKMSDWQIVCRSLLLLNNSPLAKHKAQ